jgi:hypothetical protein
MANDLGEVNRACMRLRRKIGKFMLQYLTVYKCELDWNRNFNREEKVDYSTLIFV